MSTCNFSKVNARGFYALEDVEDLTFKIDDLREMAKSREDGRRFYEQDVPEHCGPFRRRDAGQVILGYSFDSIVLPGGVVLSLDGQIMWRPGYYCGAVLDWDLEINVGGERFYLSDYDGTDEMAEDALGAYCWDAGEDAAEAEARGPRRALDAIYSAFWLFFRDEEPGGIDYGTTIALDELVPFVDWSRYGKGTRAEKAAVLFDCLANYENF